MTVFYARRHVVGACAVTTIASHVTDRHRQCRLLSLVNLLSHVRFRHSEMCDRTNAVAVFFGGIIMQFRFIRILLRLVDF